MDVPTEPLGHGILALMCFGDFIFAASGALTAARYRMGILGFVLIGIITGIGGGTIRDLILGRTVWWTQNPTELVLCAAAAVITFFLSPPRDGLRHRAMIWADALGLAAFAVVGCHVALAFGAPFVVAVLLGMLAAIGGGIMRDVLTNTQPMILCGELYATAALAGAVTYAGLNLLSLPGNFAEIVGFVVAFLLRALAIVFQVRVGPPGAFIRIRRSGD